LGSSPRALNAIITKEPGYEAEHYLLNILLEYIIGLC
jgi:hypothetical protein